MSVKIARAVSLSCIVCLAGGVLADTSLDARADDCALASAAAIAQAKVSDRRTALTLADFASVAEVAAGARGPNAVFRAVEGLARKAIGYRLFTVMRLHAASAEVERLYSSLPDAYPVGGRKPKQGTPWGEQVLDRGEIFIANTPEEVERAFADHALIFSLGIGAIMNVPIRWRGRSLGTMNICAEAGWFGDDDRAPGRLLAGLLVAPLLSGG